MSIMIGNNISNFNTMTTTKTSVAGDALTQKLSGNLTNASDEQMMDACKSFESYFVTQIIKQVKESVGKTEEDQGDYVNYFGDMLYEKYADSITESGSLGIAQQLYEAMKRN